ncbi:MAG: MBL fold metallo-hydrolase [Clostridiales bacterium]|uniref:ComEC/Rec2 family competence protein n=1 Tax=Zhenhengia sp. TaxID=2944208 RepID=UPI00290BD681|nr:MBL fold metallo-hydrolase [Clostridiales bacterium]
MHKKLAIVLLALFLLITCILTGCGKQITYDEAAGRYDIIFDPSIDQDKLVMWALKIQSGTDTKSGDSTFLRSPDGKTMLIDAGAPECAPQIIDYLEELGVAKIDYLIASHPHIDHIGGMPEIINHFEIGKVYTSALEYPTKTYENFIKAIEENKLECIELKEGDTFSFGDEVNVEVFNPTNPITYYEGYPEGSTQFVNNHSIVMKLNFKERSLLFTGDVYAPQELELVKKYSEKLKADILKVPHHGADTSSTGTFRKTIQPQVAIMINDGIDSMGIYDKYRKAECNTFITFIDGCVKVSTDGMKVEVLTQFDRTTDVLK